MYFGDYVYPKSMYLCDKKSPFLSWNLCGVNKKFYCCSRQCSPGARRSFSTNCILVRLMLITDNNLFLNTWYFFKISMYTLITRKGSFHCRTLNFSLSYFKCHYTWNILFVLLLVFYIYVLPRSCNLISINSQ